MRAPSLSRRLVLYLLAAQIVGVVLTTLAIELFVEEGALLMFERDKNELAVPRTNDIVAGSLRRSMSGELLIDPSPALCAEMERAPNLRFAVFDWDAKAALAGSSPALVSELVILRRIRTTHMHFSIDGEGFEVGKGHLSLMETPLGRVTVAIYGHLFEWWDLLRTLQIEFQSYLRYFVLEVLVAVGVGWLAFKRGLEPLKRVARQTERIDLNSLHQRLPLEGVPAEISSLVDSMNGALARLDEGAERQRRFLANAAHELRTPVAILLERLDAPQQQGLMTDLRRDASRIRNIVEQLLAGARLEKRGDDLEETIDIVELGRAMVDLHVRLALKMRRNLEFSQDGASIISVRGERLALESVVANLIGNALRAEPVGGSVIVGVGPGPEICIIDHGPGISPDDRALIFEPFWRKENTSPGAGLGLAIAKELMDKLGGRIWVEDTPGGGATLRVSLPLAGDVPCEMADPRAR
ncbi:HAMP domain-containing sensor histidine kinase [Methylosinus sp. LW3]|uniref:sensor histidine kinase n=1 Tax=Methylosinus sp. LW3 TaxID=107635 RepID=UPI00046692A1|nr:HAMP domain-containing sensor histidine kinase [Methylosinus sp. LW3]